MVKGKRLTYYCIDKTCGWEETNRKMKDGLSCPVCGMLASVRPATPPVKKV